MIKMIRILKKQIVLVISILLAFLSMAFIPPDRQYLAYPDFPALGILFCLMVVVAGFMEQRLFDFISAVLTAKSKSIKTLSVLLVNCVFFTSMFVTNDVTLIAFIPITIGVLSHAGQEKLIFVIVMETIAANLGSMLTPIGNPQNLYLYSYFHIHILEFLKITVPAGMTGYIIIMCIMLASKNPSLDVSAVRNSPGENSLKSMDTGPRNKVILWYYGGLFILCILTVLNIIDYRICFLLVLVSVVVFNRKLLKKVNYGLLMTFVSFFIFTGNVERMAAIKNAFSYFITGRAFIVSVLSSQVISNLPSAMMISRLTGDARGILLGVNIGGLGTPVASLASLISFGIYSRINGSEPAKYWRVFAFFNVSILIFLVLIFSIYLNLMSF